MCVCMITHIPTCSILQRCRKWFDVYVMIMCVFSQGYQIPRGRTIIRSLTKFIFSIVAVLSLSVLVHMIIKVCSLIDIRICQLPYCVLVMCMYHIYILFISHIMTPCTSYVCIYLKLGYFSNTLILVIFLRKDLVYFYFTNFIENCQNFEFKYNKHQ